MLLAQAPPVPALPPHTKSCLSWHTMSPDSHTYSGGLSCRTWSGLEKLRGRDGLQRQGAVPSFDTLVCPCQRAGLLSSFDPTTAATLFLTLLSRNQSGICPMGAALASWPWQSGKGSAVGLLSFLRASLCEQGTLC